MKNHFIFSYAGNKRNEVEQIFKALELANKTTIIEPYCGSSAISFFISEKHPKVFKYILNDNNEKLVKLYNIMKNKKETIKFNKEINKLIDVFNKFTTDETRKTFYDSLWKAQDNIHNYFFITKWYTIRSGICPMFKRLKEIKPFDIKDYPIYNFLNNENVTIKNCDALDIIKEYKDNEKAVIIMDPPYLQTCNTFYEKPDMNIYEWLVHNNINDFKCSPMLILENIRINKLLFAKNQILEPYSKTYQTSKKKTEHIIIKKYNI
jgi:site-specific DNA-adenine methylase